MKRPVSPNTRIDGHTQTYIQSSPCSSRLPCSSVTQRGNKQQRGSEVREGIQAASQWILTCYNTHGHLIEADDPLQVTCSLTQSTSIRP